MKKIFLLTVAAGVLFASCAKNEVNSVDSSRISFRTVVGKASTKALLSGTVYKDTDPSFGTYAFMLQSGESWAANKATASLYIDNKEVKPTGPDAQKKWTTETPYYWPKNGSLTFFSYSPYDALNAVVSCTNDDKGIQLSAWDVDANQDVDVMFADKVEDQTANGTNGGYTGVPTVFRHKLSQIVSFTFQTKDDYFHNGNATGDKKFLIKEIDVNGILHKGAYSNAAWVPETGSVKDYSWYNDATGTEFKNAPVTIAESGQHILVLPQTLPDDAKIVIKYDIQTYNGTSWVTENVTEEVAIKDITASWAENKKITYGITVSLDNDMIYWAPSIEDWAADTPSHTFE